MLEISRHLFSELNECKTLYCNWKSTEHLDKGLDGLTDLDILVSNNHKNNFESILGKLNFIKCKPQYGSRYLNVEDWLGYDKQTGRLIHIHLHYLMLTGHPGIKEYLLPWWQEALESRIQEELTGVYIIDPNLEIMTLYTRIALKASAKEISAAKKEKFRLDECSQAEITFLKQRINQISLKMLLTKYYGSNKLLFDLINNETLSSENFLVLHNYIKHKMRHYRTTTAFSDFLLKKYYRIILPLRHLLRKKLNMLIINKKTPLHDGLMIAFIGQDGSGKSTVTDEIAKWLNWKLDANKFYMGSGEHYNSWQKNINNKLSNKKSNIILFILYALLTLSNNIKIAKSANRSILKGRSYSHKGGIAIFDRYPQTQYSGINDGPKIRIKYENKISNPLLKKYILYCAKVEEKFLSKAEKMVPDIVFKLILPSEISKKRKPNEDYEIIKRKHDIIESLSYPKSIVHIIDATNDYNEEIKEIKWLIWGYLIEQK